MPDSSQLVEHFFRHEYGNLVSVLTKAFGVSRIDLVEDMVSAAMLEAMHAWKQQGVPKNPAGWIHRVAKNRILDSLRRDQVHAKAVALAGLLGEHGQAYREPELDAYEQGLSDDLLTMMFVCCHPAIDRKSQIALCLKILCGFSVAEVARGLLISNEAAKKKIQRAKKLLAEENIAVEMPRSGELQQRLRAVHDVLYLMFNEGYSTTGGDDPIRDDVCEEAARLCHLLCQNDALCVPETKALLALMLFHAARLESRTDSLGHAVLLSDQDRSLWDRDLIAVGEKWLLRSAGSQPSRFHFEAMIAQVHCSAASVEATDWQQIVRVYDRLIEDYPSPVYRLNQAIAAAQMGDTDRAVEVIQALRSDREMKDYYLLNCAIGYVQTLAGNPSAAIDAYLDALKEDVPSHQRRVIQRRLEELT